MFARNALTSLALVFGLAVAPVLTVSAPAQANEEAKASPEVQAELAKLKKMAGAGEISAKEYKARKEALLAGKK